MARPLRIEYPGAQYHVTSRGIDRREIFRNDNDCAYFIRRLKESADLFKVEVIAYCLMSNHFHFLLITKEANLSRFMQRLNVTYTRYFNDTYKRVGPLMQGRYKAILVGSNDYFLTLSRYIHLNPIKIKNIRRQNQSKQKIMLMRYKWSSYPEILNPEKRSKYFSCSKVLEHTSDDTTSGRKKYEEYVLDGIANDLKSPMDEVKYQLLLGSKKFIESITEKFIKNKDLKEHPHVKGINQPISIGVLIERIANNYNIQSKSLLRRRQRNGEARQMLMALSYEIYVNKINLREIGKALGGISGSAVVKSYNNFQHRMRDAQGLKKRYGNLYKLIVGT